MTVMRLTTVLAGIALATSSIALADQPAPKVYTIAGTVSALGGGSISVKGGDRTMTCALPAAAIASVAMQHVALGVRVYMACRVDGNHLVLYKVVRAPDTTTTTTTTTTTPTPGSVYTIAGTVTALSADSISVKNSDHSMTCALPAGAASAVEAQHLAVGAHVYMGCRADGNRLVLVKVVRAGDTTSTTTTTTTSTSGSGDHGSSGSSTVDARGVVVSVRGDGLTVKRDADASLLSCAMTPSQASSFGQAFPVGSHVYVVCRVYSGHNVFVSASHA